MAIWDLESTLTHPIDFRIAASGFVEEEPNASAFGEIVDELAGMGYRVVRLDAADWQTAADFHRGVSSALDFPAYYGSNLDALNDCMWDVAEQAYGWGASDVGLVLAIDNAGSFFDSQPKIGDALATICAAAGQHGALFGNRILTLLNAGARHA